MQRLWSPVILFLLISVALLLGSVLAFSSSSLPASKALPLPQTKMALRLGANACLFEEVLSAPRESRCQRSQQKLKLSTLVYDRAAIHEVSHRTCQLWSALTLRFLAVYLFLPRKLSPRFPLDDSFLT